MKDCHPTILKLHGLTMFNSILVVLSWPASQVKGVASRCQNPPRITKVIAFSSSAVHSSSSLLAAGHEYLSAPTVSGRKPMPVNDSILQQLEQEKRPAVRVADLASVGQY
jgi:hypothetical protein